MPQRSIFRETAVEAHRRATERVVLPRLLPGPLLLSFWLLLAVVLAAAAVTWSLHLPRYVSASGVLLPTAAARPVGGVSDAVLFVPAEQASQLAVGQPVRVRSDATVGSTPGKIVKLDRTIVGPMAARQRFGLGGDLIAGPSVAAIARLDRSLPSTTYAGTHITAHIQVGVQRVISLITGLI